MEEQVSNPKIWCCSSQQTKNGQVKITRSALSSLKGMFICCENQIAELAVENLQYFTVQEMWVRFLEILSTCHGEGQQCK
ncbi:hypothetical protein GDO78_012113 [Eleutherodactylus coqui]|uniref:Uncharacterized protein n=1 Tax=Eleutherodactylus coqui TaxID=57060 RepID=A0A8J6F4V2_ELECQ|nr:hypothetical protein GDO78_012113 [Eleutherodactylus coqui]